MARSGAHPAIERDFLAGPDDDDVAEADAAFEVARAILPRVSFDLIYARQGQTPAAWRRELGAALAMAVEHLSLYQLTIEPGTRFGDLAARGRLRGLPGSEAAAEMFLVTQEVCEAAGIAAYETSNHARGGAEGRHNLVYWRYGDYAGVGPGAHGRRLGQRTVRHRKPENFLGAIARNGHALVEEEALSGEEAAQEALVMGLRLAAGIDPGALADRFQRPLVDDRAVDRLVGLELMWRSDERIGTTASGMVTASSHSGSRPVAVLTARVIDRIAITPATS